MDVIWRDGGWAVETAPRPADAAYGVFTTVGCERARPLLWGAHRRRLQTSVGALGIGLEPARLPRGRDLVELLQLRRLYGQARLRVVVQRRSGGWTTTAEAEEVAVGGPGAEPLTLVVERGRAPVLAGHKTVSRLPWELARARARAAGADDALLVEPAGHVLETPVANVCARVGDRLVTPPAGELCLPGVMRAWLLAHAEALDLTPEERALSLDELGQADEVWLTNAIVGIRRVGAIGDYRWSKWPWHERLIALGVPAPGWPRK